MASEWQNRMRKPGTWWPRTHIPGLFWQQPIAIELSTFFDILLHAPIFSFLSLLWLATDIAQLPWSNWMTCIMKEFFCPSSQGTKVIKNSLIKWLSDHYCLVIWQWKINPRPWQDQFLEEEEFLFKTRNVLSFIFFNRGMIYIQWNARF